MSDSPAVPTTAAPARRAPSRASRPSPRRRARLIAFVDALIRSIGPIVLALAVCALILLVLGRDPLKFYGDIITAGMLRPAGLQNTITRMAPVLLISGGLIVVFRANLWNLGTDGQYLLAAATVAGVGPAVMGTVPAPIGWIVLSLLAMAIGAAWTLVPSILKARYGMNEIITTLMMSFIGIGLANLLVKGPFKGTSMVPQTVGDPAGQDAAGDPGHPREHRRDHRADRPRHRPPGAHPDVVRDAASTCSARTRAPRSTWGSTSRASSWSRSPSAAPSSGWRPRWTSSGSSATCGRTGTRPTA